MTPPILTLTGNLLWERTLTFAAWAPGRTQRAAEESFQVGGKGVNVSKMLNRLGCANTALLFTGGSSGRECLAWLRGRGFRHRAFPSARPTRTGLVVRGGGRPETTFLGPDAPPGAAAVRACARYLDARPGGALLAICGSLPGWEEAGFDPLRAAIERRLSRGTVVADTYGPPLRWLARRPLALVKVNRREFEDLFGPPAPAAGFGAHLRRVAGRRPVRAWIVTDGPRAVWWLDEDGRLGRATPPRVREVSPTGSGDVLLACVLQAHWRRGLSLAEAVAFALPYAAANAARSGVADFRIGSPSRSGRPAGRSG